MLFNEEEYKLELDAFNVLYVALTRAVKGLYIFTKKDVDKNGTPKENTYSGMFISYLKNKGLWNTEQLVYTFGALNANEKKSIPEEKQIRNPYIYTEKDRPGYIKERPSIEKTLKKVLHHPELHPYFKKEATVYNEKDIITSHGEILRPDRVVLLNNKMSILDYKTGKKDSQYKAQLYSYADALSSMGYSIDKKLIVYINDQITTETV